MVCDMVRHGADVGAHRSVASWHAGQECDMVQVHGVGEEEEGEGWRSDLWTQSTCAAGRSGGR